jgi:hypothetical protein
VARWHLKEKVYFSNWRPPIYILCTLENLIGYCLPFSTAAVFGSESSTI